MVSGLRPVILENSPIEYNFLFDMDLTPLCKIEFVVFKKMEESYLEYS
jgi:hypothetical protein